MTHANTSCHKTGNNRNLDFSFSYCNAWTGNLSVGRGREIAYKAPHKVIKQFWSIRVDIQQAPAKMKNLRSIPFYTYLDFYEIAPVD